MGEKYQIIDLLIINLKVGALDQKLIGWILFEGVPDQIEQVLEDSRLKSFMLLTARAFFID